MPNENATVPNDNAGQMVLERILTVRSGINKADLNTIRLRLNDHNFCIDFVEFVQMLNALSDNCAQFQAARMHGSEGAKH